MVASFWLCDTVKGTLLLGPSLEFSLYFFSMLVTIVTVFLSFQWTSNFPPWVRTPESHWANFIASFCGLNAALIRRFWQLFQSPHIGCLWFHQGVQAKRTDCHWSTCNLDVKSCRGASLLAGLAVSPSLHSLCKALASWIYWAHRNECSIDLQPSLRQRWIISQNVNLLL